MRILAVNVGSSSIKYALFDGASALARDAVEVNEGTDLPAALEKVFAALEAGRLPAPEGVGHRLVHGGPHHLEPAKVDDALLASLRAAVPFAPLHLPPELRAIEAVRSLAPGLPQGVAFDTYFHRTMPEVASRLPIPSALAAKGLRRYGFHGLSYEYVVAALPAAARGRAIVAHLGSGASMVALEEGRSVDTTMAFTPSAGLVMSSRTGDLDPGLLIYLIDQEGYDARALERLVNHQGGLKGVSETSGDMRVLLQSRDKDPRAALAVSLFCRQARKWIGALAASLGGLDTLVFTGGIGEHSAEIRAEIAGGLEHLGVRLDAARNVRGDADLAAAGARCSVHVVVTDEEKMVAAHCARVLCGEASALP